MRTTKAAKVMLVCIGLVLVATTGAIAAYDSETTTTTTTSDVSGASNTYTLDPGNDSKSLYVETDGVTADQADLELRITVNEPGVNYTAYTNASPNAQDSTNGHYSWTITHAELDALPRDESGGTYNVSVYNATSGDRLERTTVTFDTSGEANSGAVIAVTEDSRNNSAAASLTHEVADTLSIESKSPWFGLMGSKNVSSWSGYTTVNGSSSPVTVKLADSDASQTYDAVAEDHKDGDWMVGVTAYANGQPMKVYKNTAPDSASNTTHAVYNTDSQELEINLGPEHENTSNMYLRGGAGSGYGFSEIYNNFGLWDALGSLKLW